MVTICQQRSLKRGVPRKSVALLSMTNTRNHNSRGSQILAHAAQVEEVVGKEEAEITRESGASALANVLPGKNLDGERVKWGEDTKLQNRVQLTTYPDSLGKNLHELKKFMSEQLDGVIYGLHVLPFYPSSADRGFSPLTYSEVDKKFGDWDVVQDFSKEKDFCTDFMINHISAESEEFKDFEEKGSKSEHANLFINWEKFWGGEPSKEDVERIYKRKPEAPVKEVKHKDGSVTKVWNTFSPEQIDMDVTTEEYKTYISGQLNALMDRGVNIIRLDAFGYTTKKKGTNCFFIEPDIWDVLDIVKDVTRCRDTEVLAELHEHYMLQKKLSEAGMWVYDFALPIICLHALYEGNGNNLKAWLIKCPRKQITTLDTHDGLGIVDVADLMTEHQVKQSKQYIFKHGVDAKEEYNSEKYGAMDTYQVNTTYYSALGNKDDWYLLARAIQLFTPGIPLIYYVGLFAGTNDTKLAEESKNGRNVNRHYYSLEEAEKELERPVVKTLFELCRFRNYHPAFNGTFSLLDTLAGIRDAGILEESDLPTRRGKGPEKEVVEKTPTGEVKGGFLEKVCGATFVVEDSEVDWTVNGVLSGEQPTHDSSDESSGDYDEEVWKRFSCPSAALANYNTADLESFMQSPSCIKSGKNMSANDRGKAFCLAHYRQADVDLPREIICMKWTNGDQWVALEANLKYKVFRILYTEPEVGGKAKIWNVSCTYSSMRENGNNSQ